VKILFIVPYVPNLVRVRPYQLIRSLAEAGHQVTLGTLWSEESEKRNLAEMDEVCERVVAFQLRKFRSYLSCVLALPTQKPLQYVYCWEPGLAQALEAIVKQKPRQFDVIHVEHLRGAIFGSKIQETFQRGTLPIPIVWDSVDSISHLFQQSASKSRQIVKRWITQFELARTRTIEYRLAKSFSRVLVTSTVDRDQFLALHGDSGTISGEHVSILPNGVDLTYFQPLEAAARETDTLVVSGKMSYHANISMTLYLVREIMPLVWEKRPQVKLWVVGKDPSREIVQLSENPRITVTGTVPDLRKYLQRATVAVAPIVYGAGIQNKVLEAMACATPVVTSPQALTALEAVAGKDIEQAETPQEYAEKILNLLASPAHQLQISRAGRIYVESYHRWSNISEKLSYIYQQVQH
jgi:polysaccharide biosynthesis protein PslH